MKRGKIIFFISMFILFLSLVQAAKIDVSSTKDTFKAGENVTIKVSLLDDTNNPISDQVSLIIENAEKTKRIEKTVESNQLIDIDLGEGANHGYWSMTASYNEQNATGVFVIEIEEKIKFELEKDNLIVTNIGNTQYSKTIQIMIGDTIGIRSPKLEVGEQISYRLVAPEGTYNIKVTDGTTTLIKDQVELYGATGKAVGALDERTSERSPLTGGIAPDEEEDLAIMSYIKKSKFIYIFIFVIFAAGIFIAIARRFEKTKIKE